MNIFIGGSKNIGKLNAKAQKILLAVIRNHHRILIGDCHGADLATQKFLLSKGYRDVTVYTACRTARHNAGGWKEVPFNSYFV